LASFANLVGCFSLLEAGTSLPVRVCGGRAERLLPIGGNPDGILLGFAVTWRVLGSPKMFPCAFWSKIFSSREGGRFFNISELN